MSLRNARWGNAERHPSFHSELRPEGRKAFPYSLTVPLLKDVKSQMPQAMCEMRPVGLNRT